MKLFHFNLWLRDLPSKRELIGRLMSVVDDLKSGKESSSSKDERWDIKVSDLELQEKVKNLKPCQFDNVSLNNYQTGEYAFYVLEMGNNFAYRAKFVENDGINLHFSVDDISFFIPIENITEVDHYTIRFTWKK
jgi:hypothetical protein